MFLDVFGFYFKALFRDENFDLSPFQMVMIADDIVDDSLNYHSLSFTIMSAFKRFMLVDDSCRNYAMRSRCGLAPSLLSRKIVSKYGGAEVSTYDGVVKNAQQTWTDLVLIYKFAYQTTTPLLVG